MLDNMPAMLSDASLVLCPELMCAILVAGVPFDIQAFPAASAAGAVQRIELPQGVLDKVSHIVQARHARHVWQHLLSPDCCH